MELEHSADDHGDQCLLHLDPVAGNMAIEPVFPIEHVHVGVPSAGSLVEAPGHVQFLVYAVEGVPVVGVPVAAIHQVGAHKGRHGAQVLYTAHEFLAGEVHVVKGEYRRKLQPIWAVLAEIVDPVVIGLA